MAKFSGKVGYLETVETEPGIWEEKIVERQYYGDVYRNNSSLRTGDGVNDNINISNNISIVADPYASKNFQHMRYITFMGEKWKINDVTVQYPRLVLSIGGVYNG